MVCSIAVMLAVMCPPFPRILRKVFKAKTLGPDLWCKVLNLLRAVLQSIPNAGFRCECWPELRESLRCCPHVLLYSGCQGFLEGFDSFGNGIGLVWVHFSPVWLGETLT
jgi:hypothetical protein